MNQLYNQLETNVSTGARSRKRLVKIVITLSFMAACALSFFDLTGASANQYADKKAGEQKQEERFDLLVRNDFFAGFTGDKEAFDRAMKKCEQMLAKNPKHAEALVWHGSGLLFISGQHFQKGDSQKGIKLWTRGLKEMDEAVALDPENVGVLIPRGAVLLAVSAQAPPEFGKPLLEKGVGDYEKVLKIQQAYFDKLSSHARGELLFGLAEGHNRRGDAEKARSYFERLVKEAKGSGRDKQAALFLEKGSLPPGAQMCTGCHTK